LYSIKAILKARGAGDRTDRETSYVALQPHQVSA
jgi:hypothetical protein